MVSRCDDLHCYIRSASRVFYFEIPDMQGRTGELQTTANQLFRYFSNTVSSIYIQFKHKHFTAGMTHSAATPVAESGHFKHLNEM